MPSQETFDLLCESVSQQTYIRAMYGVHFGQRCYHSKQILRQNLQIEVASDVGTTSRSGSTRLVLFLESALMRRVHFPVLGTVGPAQFTM